jgi:hypothetical protein
MSRDRPSGSGRRVDSTTLARSNGAPQPIRRLMPLKIYGAAFRGGYRQAACILRRLSSNRSSTMEHTSLASRAPPSQEREIPLPARNRHSEPRRAPQPYQGPVLSRGRFPLMRPVTSADFEVYSLSSLSPISYECDTWGRRSADATGGLRKRLRTFLL